MFVWAYPQEFTIADAASQVVGSPNRFTLVSGASHLLLLTQGYAVLDGPTMPIIGPGEPRTTPTSSSSSPARRPPSTTSSRPASPIAMRSASAATATAAFMTANLLAHSDLFRAGFARSGAYNRSLTPFGFQNETRTFWEAPDFYPKMSPFWPHTRSTSRSC